MRAAVVDSGVANLASVERALRKLGVGFERTADPAAVREAEFVVLPGVGSFEAAATLRAREIDAALHERLANDQPTLAICLGLQLLSRFSEEAPAVPGFGLLSETCQRLESGVRIPHLGWNAVIADPACRYLESGVAAFANSYALRRAPRGWNAAWTTHGARFVAALERGRFLACQFHPELSGEFGLKVMRRWLDDRGRSEANRSFAPGLRTRIVPCLDVKDGRVVKGIQFQGIRDAGDPSALASEYEKQGADEIVLLDIGASPGAREHQTETVRRVRKSLGIPLTVGGGVRTVEDARALLAAGADKIAVNTAAVQRPALIRELAEAFGSQCTVLAIDAREAGDDYQVLVMGGREPAGRDAVAWAREGSMVLGAGEILVTSWDRDGTGAGYDLRLLRAMRRQTDVPLIASGGGATAEHFAGAIDAGADALLAATIFHDGRVTVPELKRELRDAGVLVR